MINKNCYSALEIMTDMSNSFDDMKESVESILDKEDIILNGIEKLEEWDKAFEETSGQIEEKYSERLNNINSSLETKANKDSIFSMANMGQDVKEAMTGGSVAVVGDNTILTNNIVNGQVTAEKTDFLVRKNLFKGSYISNYQITGNVGAYLITRITGEARKVIAIDVEPNTTYTIIRPTIESEGGYYWFKIATCSKSSKEVIDSLNYTVDGQQTGQATTTQTPEIYKITTSATDKSLFVMCSKFLTPYCEVLKGDFTERQYTTYQESIIPNGIGVYSKKEIDINFQKITKNRIVKTGDVIDIYLKNGVYYKLEKKVTPSINFDSWQLRRGLIRDSVIWEYSDIEAPIKEYGAIDFIGGTHGDEKIITVKMLLDYKELNLSNNFDVYFEKLTVFVESTLFRCETTTPVFNRYKKLEFDSEQLIISNSLKCLVNDFKVERYTGCGLYSVYKTNLIGYTTNTTNALITSGGQSINKNMDMGIFYGNGYEIEIKTISGKTDFYGGWVQDFPNEATPRYKFYLDSINSTNGVLLGLNEVLSASFSIKIKTF